MGRVVMLQAYTKGWLGARRYKRAKEKREKSAITIQSGKWPGLASATPHHLSAAITHLGLPLLLSPFLPLLHQTFSKLLYKSSLILGTGNVVKGNSLILNGHSTIITPWREW